MIKNIFYLLIISVIANSCFLSRKHTESRPAVSHISDTTVLSGSGIIYALPMTTFTVSVEMERVVILPGPYSRYADMLLGITDAAQAKKESWNITGISVSSHEEADPSEYYVIETGRIPVSNALALKKEGLILDLNPESSSQGISYTGNEINLNKFKPADLGSDEYYVAQTDTAYKRVKMDSQFVRVPYAVEKNKKLSADELAQRAARRLMDLRDGKIMILTGEANVFPQSSAAIDEMNRLEKEYTELFVGKIFTEKITYRYNYIPRREQGVKAFTLFNFSDTEGPAQGGTPVTIAIKPEQKTKDLITISDQQPAGTGENNERLYYRIPDVVNLEIKNGEKVLYQSRRLVYQLGEVMQLPGNYIIGK